LIKVQKCFKLEEGKSFWLSMLARVVRVLKAGVEISGSGSRIRRRTSPTLVHPKLLPSGGFPIGFYRIGATLEESEGFLVHSESLTVRSMERKPFRREYEG